MELTIFSYPKPDKTSSQPYVRFLETHFKVILPYTMVYYVYFLQDSPPNPLMHLYTPHASHMLRLY